MLATPLRGVTRSLLLNARDCRSQHHSRGGEGDYYELVQPVADPLIHRCLQVREFAANCAAALPACVVGPVGRRAVC